MINRILQHLQAHPPTAPPTDYWWVETREDVHFVSASTARAIERRLDRESPPRWLVFRDVFGARRRILASSVRVLGESTAAQREAVRAFRRARQREADEDRNPWDEGERS